MQFTILQWKCQKMKIQAIHALSFGKIFRILLKADWVILLSSNNMEIPAQKSAGWSIVQMPKDRESSIAV